jgi:DNA polymerase I
MCKSTEQTNGNEDLLLIVDGHSLAFRAYYALPVESFSTSQGQPTNAIWGFAQMLSQVIESENPTHICVAFDMAGGTFRSQMLPQYKGTRDAAPEDLISQLPQIQKFLDTMGVTYVEKQGYEGDDIIASLATQGEAAGYRTLVLSGDRDAFQLVDDKITVLFPGYHFSQLQRMTPQAVEEKYHVSPQIYSDLAAIRGEQSDNIPGVPGVGDGFASRWLNQYGDLAGIIEHAEELPGKKGQAFRDNIDQVQLNRKVNALVRDLDLGVSIDDLTFGHVNLDEVTNLFNTLEFSSRTRSKLLKGFQCSKDITSVSTSHQNASDNKINIEEPIYDTIEDVASLDSWCEKHLPSKESSQALADTMPDAAPVIEAAGDGVEVTQNEDVVCPDLTQQAWYLYVQGQAKPGASKLEQLVLLSRDNHAVVIDEQHVVSFADCIQKIIEERIGSCVVYGYKEHIHMLHAVGLCLPMPLFDVKLAQYLVEPDFHASGIDQAFSHTMHVDLESKPEIEQGALDFGDEVSEETSNIGKQCLLRAMYTKVMAESVQLTIEQRRQFNLLRIIEMPTSLVLAAMEQRGAKVNVHRLKEMGDEFSAEAQDAQNIAWDRAGEQVNLQSPKQLQKVLFDDMGLKPTKRTKSGSYSTNAAALQKLYIASIDNERANDFLGALLKHRETNKLKQIVNSLMEAVNPSDGSVHTTYEQTVAATGRLSSVDPNLQNIPNKNAAGREIRSAFVHGDSFENLLSCDYSQVELRIMADLSGDETLIEAFKSGVDFHKYVASLVFQIPVDEVNTDQRSRVKAMSYGLAYGLSTYGLAQQLNVSPAEADVLRSQYFATFGKVHDYLESLVVNARVKGYTETIFGRRRYFPGLTSKSRVTREAAERAALNAPIQGSAADIMKVAMIKAEHALNTANCKSRIILQIHDELVVEVARGEAEEVTKIVSDAMEHAVDLAVPLDVSTGIGNDWQQAAH